MTQCGVRTGVGLGAGACCGCCREPEGELQQRLRRRLPRAATAALIPIVLVLVMASIMLRPASAWAGLVGVTAWRSSTARAVGFHASALSPLRRPLPGVGMGWARLVAAATGASDEKEEVDEAAVRAAMLEEGRRRMAKAEAQKSIMVNARKEKLRRHKKKQAERSKGVSEEERERRRAREAAAGAVMEWLYEQEEDEPGRSTPSNVDDRRLRVAIDLWYDRSDSQYSSLARQLGVHLTAARGPVMDTLAKNGGDAWRWRRHEAPVFEVFPLERLVYLTPDSPNMLQKIDPSKVYVVGGLVDRVVLKGRSLGRAQSYGVATARLPLPEFFKRAPNGQKYLSNLCLAVDRVIEILMRVERNGGDWEAALTETFPLAMEERGGDKGGGGGGEEGATK